MIRSSFIKLKVEATYCLDHVRRVGGSTIHRPDLAEGLQHLQGITINTLDQRGGNNQGFALTRREEMKRDGKGSHSEAWLRQHMPFERPNAAPQD